MIERLVVVSNRLPVTIKKDGSVPGGYIFKQSAGGLVSALRGTKKLMSFTWIGWPGVSVPESSIPYIEATLKRTISASPYGSLKTWGSATTTDFRTRFYGRSFTTMRVK